MKKALFTASLLMIATPAMAMKITNLDNVPHNVELSGKGAPEVRVIEPGATEFYPGASHGFLAVVDMATPTKGKKPAHSSVVHADGLLSGIIGNERNEQIPADPDNNYVIWPGGQLKVQSRTKHGGNAF